MESEPTSGTPPLTLSIRTTLFDFYRVIVYTQYIRPALWLNMGLFLWMSYQSATSLLHAGGVFLAVLGVLLVLVWVVGLSLILPLLYTAFVFLTNKLRGVIGEHELMFRDAGLTERTAFNEQTIKYESFIHLYETFGSFLLMKSNMSTFLIPKKQLSPGAEQALRERLAPWKKARPLITPYIVAPFFLAALVILGLTMNHSQNLVMTHPRPVLVALDDRQLYVSSGRTQIGQKIRYWDLIGFGLLASTPQGPAERHEQYLWHMQNGVTRRYELSNINIAALCMADSRLLAVSSRSWKEKDAKVYIWESNAFRADPGATADAVLKRCGSGSYGASFDEDGEEDDRPPRSSTARTRRFVVPGKPLVASLGASSYELSMERGEEVPVAIGGLFGNEARSMTVTLSGRWIGPGSGTEELLSIEAGSRSVTNDAFRALFSGQPL